MFQISEIIRDSKYKLSQFPHSDINDLEKSIVVKKGRTGDEPYVTCLIRNKDIKLTPEEVVRQLFLRVLQNKYDYPLSRINSAI
jgi:type I restriction enzyme M protein